MGITGEHQLNARHRRANERFEKVYLRALLARTGNNVRRAAEVAGVNRRWLQRLLAEHGRASLVADDDDSDGGPGGGRGDGGGMASRAAPDKLPEICGSLVRRRAAP